MTTSPETPDVQQLVGEWLTLPDIAEALQLKVQRVRQLIAEHQLVALRLDGVLRVPAAFIQDGAVLKGLPGTLTVLSDSGYSDEEAVRWLYTAEDSLPGRPIDALVENRGTEVKRRAQASAF